MERKSFVTALHCAAQGRPAGRLPDLAYLCFALLSALHNTRVSVIRLHLNVFLRSTRALYPAYA